MQKIIRICCNEEEMTERIEERISPLLEEGWEVKEVSNSICLSGTTIYESCLFILQKDNLLDRVQLEKSVAENYN